MTQFADVRLGLLDVLADASADLDYGLMHLRLDALFHQALSLGDDLAVNVRAKVSRFGIDGLVFLFDSDGE